jgi:anti-sigma regulatory factor (Ser/Thr protein kinase)
MQERAPVATAGSTSADQRTAAAPPLSLRPPGKWRENRALTNGELPAVYAAGGVDSSRARPPIRLNGPPGTFRPSHPPHRPRGQHTAVAIHDDPLVLELAPEAPSVAVARAAVSEVAARCGACVYDVALCVSEAVSNAVVHAFRDREDGSGTIRVLAGCTEEGILCVTVEDDGRGILEPRPDSPGLGLGLPTIGAMALSVQITATDGGSRIRMRFEARG